MNHPLMKLGFLGLLTTSLVVATHWLTKDAINQAQHKQEQSLLLEVSGEHFAGEWAPHRVSGASILSGQQIYLARDQSIQAIILPVTAPDGYNGDIRLLVGLDPSGSVIAVRALEHQETPGLGDRIELRHSDWIRQFEGLSLLNTDEGDWLGRHFPSKPQARFDILTGATITSRSLIRAVYQSLIWYQAHPLEGLDLKAIKKGGG